MNPESLTKDQLKDILIANEIKLPAAKALKGAYVDLYKKNIKLIKKSSKKPQKTSPAIEKVNTLSNFQIATKLKSMGCNIGPVNASTRKVYVNMLAKSIESGFCTVDKEQTHPEGEEENMISFNYRRTPQQKQRPLAERQDNGKSASSETGLSGGLLKSPSAIYHSTPDLSNVGLSSIGSLSLKNKTLSLDTLIQQDEIENLSGFQKSFVPQKVPSFHDKFLKDRISLKLSASSLIPSDDEDVQSMSSDNESFESVIDVCGDSLQSSVFDSLLRNDEDDNHSQQKKRHFQPILSDILATPESTSSFKPVDSNSPAKGFVSGFSAKRKRNYTPFRSSLCTNVTPRRPLRTHFTPLQRSNVEQTSFPPSSTTSNSVRSGDGDSSTWLKALLTLVLLLVAYVLFKAVGNRAGPNLLSSEQADDL